MKEFDLVIRGGTVVDGTGIPRYKADVGVKDGRIAMISGVIKAGAARELDASGCIVAPGAIDLHTHYDAQLNWDPYATLSGWFGVTSLTIGMCGFGFAPTRPDDRDQNMRMMDRIEAIPLESMRKGMRWDWETFPEYLDSLERQGLGVNVGSVFPFSPLRAYVLGMQGSRERTSVTDAELNQMKQIFREAMEAGAFGFSADKNLEDRPEDGSPLPSHVASKREFLGLAEVLGDFGVGQIGWTSFLCADPEENHELMLEMMELSGRPLHVGLEQGPGTDGPGWIKSVRESRGLPLLSQEAITGNESTFTLAEYNLFDYLPNWIDPLVGTAEERIVKLRDPERRAAMLRDLDTNVAPERTDWNRVRIVEVSCERNYQYEGHTIAKAAEMMGKSPFDTFLDLALDEDLKTVYNHPLADGPGPERIKDPYSHISFSDGGAHTRFSVSADWPVEFLGRWIRDEALMTLEEAHYKMSAYPAWFADFKDRGMLRVGKWADLMVYDLDELGYLYDEPVYANDFPGGERRLLQKARGLRYTLVNGTVTFEENDCSGALPGQLLRSYDMLG